MCGASKGCHGFVHSDHCGNHCFLAGDILLVAKSVALWGGGGGTRAGRGRNGALGVPTAQVAVSWILLEQID